MPPGMVLLRDVVRKVLQKTAADFHDVTELSVEISPPPPPPSL